MPQNRVHKLCLVKYHCGLGMLELRLLVAGTPTSSTMTRQYAVENLC
jgi:hypothetical protein